MLVVDIGNTDSVLALYSQQGICELLYRIPTQKGVTGAELAKKILSAPDALLTAKPALAILSSVAPEMNSVWREVLSEIFKAIRIYFVDHESPWSFRNITQEPEKVGHDRLCNMEAALRYGPTVVVVDAGTATKFDLLENEVFMGGAIAPGFGTSFSALVGNASQLFSVNFEVASPVIGRNTEEALRSGALNSFSAQVDGFIEKIFQERALPITTPVIATGGFSRYLQGRAKSITHFSPHHTLEGLYAVSKKI